MDVVGDLRAGLDDEALMSKYAISEKQLKRLLQKLVDGGFIKQSELDARAGYLSREKAEAKSEPFISVEPDSDEKDLAKQKILDMARFLADACGSGHSDKRLSKPSEIKGTQEEVDKLSTKVSPPRTGVAPIIGIVVIGVLSFPLVVFLGAPQRFDSGWIMLLIILGANRDNSMDGGVMDESALVHSRHPLWTS